MKGISLRRLAMGLFGGISLALLAVLGFKPSPLFIDQEVVVERGFQGDAAADPYFALRLLLEELGVENQTLNPADDIPAAVDTILLDEPFRSWGRVDPLLRWAEAGGHLIVIAHDPGLDAALDPYLDRLDIEWAYGRSPSELAEEWEAIEGEAPSDEGGLAARQEGLRQRLPARLDASFAEPDRFWGDESEAIFATFRQGSGWVTPVASSTWLQNGDLARFENAEMAWELVAPDGAPQTIAFLHHGSRQSLLATFAERARPLVLALAVWIVAALMALVRRHGPTLPPASTERRQLAEHVRAMGEYLWRVRSSDVLLHSVRQSLERRITAGDEVAGAALGRRLDELAQTHQLDPAAVREAWASLGADDPSTFLAHVRTLETLRRTP